ncbi:hypothetical protein MHYP_G00081030 [Metynnis hypsauchen]
MFLSARVPGIQIIWTHNKMSMMEMTEEATLLDGKFKYKKLPDGSINKNIVICSLCRKEFANHRSTSTLRYHLDAEHVGASVQVSNDNLAAKCISSTSKQCRQSTLDHMSGFKLRNKMSKSTSDKLTNSLARWIAVDCRPLSVIEDKGLQEALQIASADASYELPSRKTMSKKIQQLNDEEREVKQVIVKSATNVALTGDHWTSVSNKNYLGVTAHIIDDEWKIQSFALSMQKTTSRHYGDACAEDFMAVAEAWEIKEKVTTIGTDSARNMIVAARRLPFQHMPCVAHMLQRTLNVCLLDSEFSDILARCRKIVGHFKHSPANTEDLHQQQTALEQDKEPLIQDVRTRWNSTLYMIKRLLKNQEAVKATLARQKHKLTMLTATEWNKLQNLVTLLEPCRYVTELLGAETYVSCSVVLPALLHLEHTMKVSDEDTAYVIRYKTAFTKELSQRKAMLNHEWLRIASALDPRFKNLKCIPKGERERVWNSLEALLQEPNSITLQTTDEPAKKKSFLLFASDSSSDEEQGPNRILSLYRAEPTISETTCSLQWWSCHAGAHPQLSALAQKYLSSPATSVPCERLFSLAGNIVQKKRAALTSENVERLVCLSNWLKKQ